VVGLALEIKDADEAGDTCQVHPAAEAHEHQGQPQEGSCSGAGRTEKADSLEPWDPK